MTWKYEKAEKDSKNIYVSLVKEEEVSKVIPEGRDPKTGEIIKEAETKTVVEVTERKTLTWGIDPEKFNYEKALIKKEIKYLLAELNKGTERTPISAKP